VTLHLVQRGVTCRYGGHRGVYHNINTQKLSTRSNTQRAPGHKNTQKVSSVIKQSVISRVPFTGNAQQF